MGELMFVPFAVAALAESGALTFDVTQVMTDSVQSVQTQMFSVLAIVVPAIVAVVAAVVGIKFGIGWLKKIRA